MCEQVEVPAEVHTNFWHLTPLLALELTIQRKYMEFQAVSLPLRAAADPPSTQSGGGPTNMPKWFLINKIHTAILTKVRCFDKRSVVLVHLVPIHPYPTNFAGNLRIISLDSEEKAHRFWMVLICSKDLVNRLTPTSFGYHFRQLEQLLDNISASEASVEARCVGPDWNGKKCMKESRSKAYSVGHDWFLNAFNGASPNLEKSACLYFSRSFAEGF